MKDNTKLKDDNVIGGGINKMNTFGSKASPIKIKGYTSNKVGGPIINKSPIKI